MRYVFPGDTRPVICREGPCHASVRPVTRGSTARSGRRPRWRRGLVAPRAPALHRAVLEVVLHQGLGATARRWRGHGDGDVVEVERNLRVRALQVQLKLVVDLAVECVAARRPAPSRRRSPPRRRPPARTRCRRRPGSAAWSGAPRRRLRRRGARKLRSRRWHRRAAPSRSRPGPCQVSARPVVSRLASPVWAASALTSTAADPRPNQPWAVPSSKSLARTTTGSFAIAGGGAAAREAASTTAPIAPIARRRPADLRCRTGSIFVM